MPLALQVKLLRALQERVVVRVGDTSAETVDIRILAATNRDLEDEIKAGRFREDLYYRLNVVNLHLPPLRERGDDVLVLARYLVGRYAREYGGKVQGLHAQRDRRDQRKHSWPGNIRELENRIKKAIVLADKALLGPEDLGPDRRRPAADPAARRGQGEVPARLHQRGPGATTATAPRPRATSASIRARSSATSRRAKTAAPTTWAAAEQRKP